MRVQFLPCLAAASHLLSAAASAAAPAAVVLEPLRGWNLHYSDNSCQLFRAFGDPSNPTSLAIESLAPDTGMSMLIYGGALTSKPDSGEAKASFVPATGRTFDNGRISETTKAKQTAIYWGNVSLLSEEPSPASGKPDRTADRARVVANRAVEMRTAASVTGLEIVEPGRRVTMLRTGSLAKVMEMLRECNREQMQGWGLDPAVQDKIVVGASAKRNIVSLFSEDDYPALAARSGQMAVVTARLIIGADGKVSRCTSLTPFTGTGFKEIVCERLSKAVFEPAELADGTKVPTFDITRVVFKMPD